MLPIAVDAMGGDNAPDDIVAGAELAKSEGLEIVLVGDEPKLTSMTDIPVVASTEVIGMSDEPASSVRAKKDSSVVVANKLVADGKASAVVSAGNTGAALASSLLKLGRIKGVSRPTIAVPFPGISGPVTLVDTGANADCDPNWLIQFGRLGSIYMNHRFKVDRPKVAVLTIGEEAGKGNKLVKETCQLAEEFDWDSVGAEFVGNVEGNDFLTGVADVVISDGFTGNIVLKSLEGVYDLFKEEIETCIGGIEGALEATLPMFEKYDPVNVGTGVLLGLKHISMIAHGSSSPRAIANAIQTANELLSLDMVGVQRQELG